MANYIFYSLTFWLPNYKLGRPSDLFDCQIDYLGSWLTLLHWRSLNCSLYVALLWMPSSYTIR